MNKDIAKEDLLLSEINELIIRSKNDLAITVNSTITQLYWEIGNKINQSILENKRAEYGKTIIKNISNNLEYKFGKGWSEKHLRHCLRFAETFTDKQNVYALSRELSWTHFRTFAYLENDLKRDFYIEMYRIYHRITT